MRLLLLLAVLAAACGDAGGGGVGATPSVEPVPGQTDAGPGSGDEQRRGRLAGDAALEGGCAWLDTAEGQIHVLYPEGYAVVFDPALQLIGPDGEVVAQGGEEVAVTGRPRDDVATTCMTGPVFEARTVE